MFVVCCLQCVVSCVMFVICFCCLSSLVNGLLFVVHHAVFVVCCLVFAV